MKSVDSPKPIRLKYLMMESAAKPNTVRYERGIADIPLRRISSKVTDKPEGRPWAHEEHYREAGGGVYTIATQGGRFYGFTFKRADGKTFQFEEELEAEDEKGCTWEKKGR